MRLLLTAIVLLWTGTAEAQWRTVHPGAYGWGPFYWGSGRYWGPYGRMGGYYNYGDYRWNGVSPWRYRNYY